MNGFIKCMLILSLSLSAFGLSAQTKDTKDAKKDSSKAVTDMIKDDDDKDPENEVADILNSMGYPELQVVPRASERLRMEAKAERGSWFVMHWPVELSGLATMGVGLTSKARQKENISDKEEKDHNTIAMLTTGVGAAWLVGGVLLGGQMPYQRGYKSLGKPSEAAKDERKALMRERLAEETLERPAKVMRTLQHISVATNLAMNVLNMAYVDDQGKVTAGVAAILSFLPYMFEDHSISVYNKHIEYKKKIYTPIKGASLYWGPEAKEVTPLTTLTWVF